MKTDLYTKIVLTVIAVFLALNFFKDTNVVTPAQAALPTPTVATQTSGVMDVNIVQVAGTEINKLSSNDSFYGLPIYFYDVRYQYEKGLPVKIME